MPKKGGARANAGRPSGSGRFKEPTRAMRIPESLVGIVSELLESQMRASTSIKNLSNKRLDIERPAPETVTVLNAIEARDALDAIAASGIKADVVMLDPWYRAKGPEGRGAYLTEIVPLLSSAARVGDHVFLWGFPEALARVVDHWPETLKLEAWLTWHFKNIPSRAKGWRPAQQCCLHLRRHGSKIYPEAFYNERHKIMAKDNRLEFKMGPLSVFEDALMTGFIKRTEQTGHACQKPVSVFERLLRMTTQPGGLVIDPTAGSGTAGVAALRLGCSAIVSDRSIKSTRLMKARIDKEQMHPTKRIAASHKDG